MKTEPKMLRVETGYISHHQPCFMVDHYVDYRVYEKIPKWWRWIEKILRFDLYLAIEAKRLSQDYDIIWANSEKVAVPLSFLGVKKPLVVILQYPESPLRILLLKLTNIAKGWAGTGIVSPGSRKLLEHQLNIDPRKIFQYYSARLDIYKPGDDVINNDAFIMSAGVAKRDYKTLIKALSQLKGYRTEIFVSSKYGDLYRGSRDSKLADWISYPGRVSEEELVTRYQQARFVVIPLKRTFHSGAGVSAVFEASASGKAVIATRTGGMEEYVIDGKTGILVPPNDVAAMKEAIKTLWEYPDQAIQMGKAGREYMETKYNFEIVNSKATAFLIEIWKASQKGIK